MENKLISKTFKLLAQLMELHQENPFKIKSIANASFKIDKLPFQLTGKSAEEIAQLEGIGKSTAAKISALLQKGSLQDLDDLLNQTPSGIVEMLGIKGLGPKKIIIIWKNLGIENVGELYYACNENRLIEAKGFGLKTQEDIKKAIEFKMASNGRFLFARIEGIAEEYLKTIQSLIQQKDQCASVLHTGEYRRKCEIIDELSFLIISQHPETVLNTIAQFESSVPLEYQDTSIRFRDLNGLKIACYTSAPWMAGWNLFQTTGSATHVEQVGQRLKDHKFETEEEVYAAAGLQFVEPELREGLNEVNLAAAKNLPSLIQFNDLKGALHNHSTWSDGVHSIEEMARYCRDILRLEYLGLCDHSKTAVYANGLNIDRVLQQHEEIDNLNKQLSPFRIFKGIESDILSDGSLDYPDDILKLFDFIVASVHSQFKMSEEKATERLIKAIENPYTTILGHPTGRLLLSRDGYPLDFKKVIDACAANGVVIEINANPLRLDLDWRWHRYATEKGVLLSINPDAHRNEGFMDMQYGLYVARKGGLSAANCLNSYTLKQIEEYFNHRKTR